MVPVVHEGKAESVSIVVVFFEFFVITLEAHGYGQVFGELLYYIVLVVELC